MRLGSLVTLVRLSLTRDKKGAASSVFGVAVGISALVFFVSLGLGISRVVSEKIFPVDSMLIEVVPAPIAIGLLGGGKLDGAAVERLKQVPGVKAAYRKMSVRMPAVSRYSGNFFGSQLHVGFEVLAVGVDPELVKADVQLGKFADGEPIPAVAATRLLEIYNKTFAPARSLPQLSPAMVVGFEFPVEFNRSFVSQGAAGPLISSRLQLVGVSDRGMLAGVTIPLETAIRLNRAVAADAESFSAVTLVAEDAAKVSSIVAEVKQMGFRVDDQERRFAQNAGAAVAVTTGALALLSALICLLAAVNIGHALAASLRARQKELGLMRAVGASARDIRWCVLGEALVLGAMGGAIGTAVAVGFGFGLDALALKVLPEFPFKPDTFFLLRSWVVFGGVGLGIVSSLLGALLPSRLAAAVDPAKVLAQ